MRIGLTGKGGSGKSTIAKYLAKKYGAPIFSFATPIKNFTYAIFGRDLDRNKEKYRRFMQVVGSEVRRVDPAAWIEYLDYYLWPRMVQGYNLVVDDVRFLNEAEYLRKQGFMLIRVVGRSKVLGAASAHVSETEQDEIEADFTLDNSGSLEETIEDLEKILNRRST